MTISSDDLSIVEHDGYLIVPMPILDDEYLERHYTVAQAQPDGGWMVSGVDICETIQDAWKVIATAPVPEDEEWWFIPEADLPHAARGFGT